MKSQTVDLFITSVTSSVDILKLWDKKKKTNNVGRWVDGREEHRRSQTKRNRYTILRSVN